MIKAVKIPIWGRDFDLPVEYEYYASETETDEQINAIKEFLFHEEWIEAARKDVEEYCRRAVLEDEENEKKDNVFSYIKPDYFFVKRDEYEPRIALMCKYRYDPEHGVAIVFSHEGKTTVGIQDIIL